MEAFINKFVTIKTYIEDEPQECMFEIKTQTLHALLQPESNDVLVKCLYVSIDPIHITRMKVQSSSQSTSVVNISKIIPGNTINGSGLGRVVASKHPDFHKNDIVYGSGSLNWAEYTIVKGGNMLRKVDTLEFPLSYHVGIFG
ncbi:hypothetical protein CTI12_AA055890 [Artemisia annua]|uniref:Oxidoreductase N-terminal domain-containing protein n=1 Tax=Artemisia annua TaxID=35608 RepID=A0A2U1Q9Z0_ARTAN|nr:hypothetical protein CTI12_AA055890 [Artemisia annua]